MTVQHDPNQLQVAAADLEDALATLQESGVFSKEPARTRQNDAIKALQGARTALADHDWPESGKLLSEARGHIQDAWASRHPLFRLFRRYPFHVLAYHLLVFAILLNVATGWSVFGRIAGEFWGVPVEAIGFGALGGVLRGMYWLQVQVNRGVYRIPFELAHYAAPWVSGLFGLLVYLLLKAGMLTLEGGSGVNLEDSVGVYALVFFAGYSWEWVLQWLEGLRARLRAAEPKASVQEAQPPESPVDSKQLSPGAVDRSAEELFLQLPGRPPITQQPSAGPRLLGKLSATPPDPIS